VDLHRPVEDREDHVTDLAVHVLGTAVGIAPAGVLSELRRALTDLRPADSADRELTLLDDAAAALWRHAAGAWPAVCPVFDAVRDGHTDRSMAAATVDQLVRVGLIDRATAN
jgi:hypothetical protein